MDSVLNSRQSRQSLDVPLEPILIGLSGPSCSGKNTASAILQDYGFYCIDADVVSRKVFAEHEKEILNLFQAEAEKRGINLKNKKGIDKKAFALLVFSDEELLKKHEAFILPIIEEKIWEEIKMAFTEKDESHKKMPLYIVHRCTFYFKAYKGKKKGQAALKKYMVKIFKTKEILFSILFFKCRYNSSKELLVFCKFKKKTIAGSSKKRFLRLIYGTEKNFMDSTFYFVVCSDYLRCRLIPVCPIP